MRLRKWLPDVKKCRKVDLAAGPTSDHGDLYRNCDRRDQFWSEILFLDFNTCQRTLTDDPQAYRPLGLYSRFIDLLQDIAVEKAAFDKYVRLMKRLKIPQAFPAAEKDALMAKYQQLERNSFSSVGQMMHNMTSAIALHQSDTPSAIGRESQSSIAASSSERFVKKGDRDRLHVARIETLLPNRGVYALVKGSKARLCLQQILSLLPDRPRVSEVVRGLTESEFRTFCPLDKLSVRHHRTLREFVRMVDQACGSSATSSKMRLTERKSVEDLRKRC